MPQLMRKFRVRIRHFVILGKIFSRPFAFLQLNKCMDCDKTVLQFWTSILILFSEILFTSQIVLIAGQCNIFVHLPTSKCFNHRNRFRSHFLSSFVIGKESSYWLYLVFLGHLYFALKLSTQHVSSEIRLLMSSVKFHRSI